MHRFIYLVALVVFLAPASSFAVDSCENAETLKSCVDMNVATCREEASCADDDEQALTASDVSDAAIERCCDRSGKRQRRCLRVERRRLNRARARAPRSVKSFLRQARSEVSNINCETNTVESF